MHSLFCRRSVALRRGYTTTKDYPGKKLNFLSNAANLKADADSLISNGNKLIETIISTKEATFDNTVKRYELAEGEDESILSSIIFANYVSTDPSVRAASAEATAKLQSWSIETLARQDFYDVFARAKQNTNSKALSPVDSRLMDKYLLDFKRNGLALDENTRNKLKELRKRESDLQIEFQKNLNEDVSAAYFTIEELEGLPNDFINNLKTKEENGQKYYIVTLKYPDLIPTLQMAKREETRKKLDILNASKVNKINTPMLEEVIQIRYDAAKLLGYKNHAEFQLEVRMAKTPDAVLKFLNELKDKLLPQGRKDLDKLLQLKKQEKLENKLPFDGKMNSWDTSYYNNLLLQRDFQVNREEVKQYFPLEHVTNSMLELYQKILGLKFEEISIPNSVWHPDVRSFLVFDSTSNTLIGQFYLDLFPREGKYPHAAVFPLLHHYVKEDGGKSLPVAAMVANFPKPSSDKPSLLDHSDVVTYFHELGHVFHGLCSTAKYRKFSGTSVEQDFVETPSQMLENWCWQKEILSQVSKHHSTKTSLPSQLIDRMIQSKNLNAGLFNLRQLLYGTFDMNCHIATGKIDTASLWNKLSVEISLIPSPENTNRAASFGHIMGGYDAGYYGYMWSKVYSSDLFSQFEKEGVLNPTLGRKYRDKILAPGYERDGMDSIVDFLGRAPVVDPFLKEIGLSV